MYKNFSAQKKVLVKPNTIICNKCKKEFDLEEDFLEIQELLIFKNQGGYGSIFGDGVDIELVLCQYCQKEILSPYMLFNNGVSIFMLEDIPKNSNELIMLTENFFSVSLLDCEKVYLEDLYNKKKNKNMNIKDLIFMFLKHFNKNNTNNRENLDKIIYILYKNKIDIEEIFIE